MKVTNKRIVATAAISALALAMPISALAGFFPANRQTYTCANPTSCRGADHVTFNSFTNNSVVGDERPFLSGKVDGTAGNVQDLVNVKDGDVVTLRAYVHNNADPSLIGANAAIARNVKLHVNLPKVSQKDQTIVAFLSASNANPATINDTMNLHGDRPFTVQYVSGSAKFDRKQDGVNMVTSQLSDNLVGANGTYLGDMRGCFEYSGYVTLKAKVNMPGAPVTQTTPPAEQPQVPAAPAPLPETGPEAPLAAAAGTSAIGYAVLAYRRSKLALVDKLLNRQ